MSELGKIFNLIGELCQDLPIIIPLVIYHGKGNWIAAKSLGNMVTGYHLFPKELKNMFRILNTSFLI